jgi:hypothetical protein
MATFSNIGGAEPSTVTFRVATVELDRGGTVEDREIMVLGDGESTNGIARVLASTPGSTEWGLVVREAVPQSTQVNVSSVAGAVIVRSSAAEALVTVYQSTASNLQATVTQASTVWAVQQGGYVAPSTTIQVSSVAGSVIVRSSAADALVTVYQSTYTAFNALSRLADRDASTQVANITNTTPASTAYGLVVREAVAQSTTVNVSSLAGAVITRSSAANSLHTVYQSTASDLLVTAHGNQSSNSSVYLPVRLTNGTAFLTPATDYTDASTASNLTGPTLLFDNGTNATMRAISITRGLPVEIVAGSAAGSTLVTVRQSTYTDFNTLSRLADRDNSTKVAAVLSEVQPASTAYGLVVRMPAPITDSTNNALRVNVVAGSAAGSTEVTVRQSTYTDFNTLSRLADRDASTQVANITNTTPASTAYGLVIRDAIPQSTTVNVSSLAGAVMVRSSAADALVTVYQSTASALQATVSQNSTAWSVVARATTSSGGLLEGSTAAPAQGALGLHVRQAFSSCQSTTAAFTSSNSTVVREVIASVAGMRFFVSAYAVFASTSGNPSTLVFMSSLAIDRWSVGLSSGFSGANMAVSQPGWIFRTDAQNALNLRIESASTAITARVSLSWFTEP